MANAAAIIERLARAPDAFRTLASIASDTDARWKPAPEHWSILEICCHVLDEEREDFRMRLRATLADPSCEWPPLLLDQIAEKRRYNERDISAVLVDFASERGESIIWLRSLEHANWSQAHKHPKFGPIAAGDLLSSWAAHDALHLRQIAKRLHGLAVRDGVPHTTRYAGEWSS